MPTYEFGCPAGHTFEKFYLKISDATSELPCPECGQVAARRVSGGAGLLFKGSGFYITDYGKDGKKSPAPAGERKGESGEGKAGGAGGESKPAESKASESKPAESKTSGEVKPSGKRTASDE